MAEVLAAGVRSSVRAGGGASVKVPPGGGRVAGAFPYGSVLLTWVAV